MMDRANSSPTVAQAEWGSDRSSAGAESRGVRWAAANRRQKWLLRPPSGVRGGPSEGSDEPATKCADRAEYLCHRHAFGPPLKPPTHRWLPTRVWQSSLDKHHHPRRHFPDRCGIGEAKAGHERMVTGLVCGITERQQIESPMLTGQAASRRPARTDASP